jgi:transposase
MTKTQVEVTPSLPGRRRWSKAEKERIVATAMEPGAVVSAVAREAGIQASQLFRWRRQLCDAPRFAGVTVAAAPNASPISPLSMPSGLIEIEFATGARLRISGTVDAPTVSAVLQALAAWEQHR